jgi:CheY-like chemotaxis protein
MIRAVADDAAKVVDRLREFSRQRGEGEVLVPVDLNELVERCVLLTQPRWRNQAQAAGVTIRVETDLQPLPPVMGNAADLRDALTNLIFNAVDAMPRGGTLTIRTRLDGQRARLEIADTGVGMSEEVRRRCFDPFFTTRGESGTGLGLSMVYGTIQRHEGTIDVESAPQQGTTFILRLPVAANEPVATPPPAPVDALRASRRVLLVEDEAALRRILTEFLTIDRHVVETAANGREGLDKFLANRELEDPNSRFELVITDLAMPQMSGDQLAAAIKRADPSMPIILLTGLGEMLRAQGDQPEGVDLVVAKPISIAALQRAIAQVSDGR